MSNLQKHILAFVEWLLPRGLREECMHELRKVYQPVGDLVNQSVKTIIGAYRVQVSASFNRACFVLELGAGVYIFTALTPEKQSVVAMVLPYILILRFRSARNFPSKIKKLLKRQKSAPEAPWRGSTDSLGDAVWAAIMILAPQSLMVLLSPSLPAFEANGLRGAFLMLPLMGCIRMSFRPRFDLKMPFQGSKLTATQICRRTWGLTAMWVLAFVYVSIGNPDPLPAWIPFHDFIRTYIPYHWFIYWVRLQQNPLIRRDHIETLMGDWEKKEKARKREILIKGLKKGEPFYRAYVVMQAMLFLYLATPLAMHLCPWLAGYQTNLDWFRVSLDVVTLVTLVWTWNYVKDANRIAAEAVQQEIDSMEWGRPYQPKLEWRKRLMMWVKQSHKKAPSAPNGLGT